MIERDIKRWDIQMRNTVVLADVAQLARASRAAVGKVLNGGSDNIRVGAATRERILAAARELNYQPNMAASILAGGDSRLVGVILDSYAHYRSQALLIELEQRAARQGYRILIASSHDSPANIRQDCAMFAQYQVSGVICLSHDYPEFREEIADVFADRPKTVFLEKPAFPARHWVATSRQTALTGMVGEALRAGSRRFAVVHALEKYHSERTLRREFLAALTACGLAIGDEACFGYPETVVDSIAARAEWLLKECVEKYRPDWLYIDDAITAVSLQSRMRPEHAGTRLLGGNHNPLFGSIAPAIASLDPEYGMIAERLLERALDPERSWAEVTVESTYRSRSRK